MQIITQEWRGAHSVPQVLWAYTGLWSVMTTSDRGTDRCAIQMNISVSLCHLSISVNLSLLPPIYALTLSQVFITLSAHPTSQTHSITLSSRFVSRRLLLKSSISLPNSSSKSRFFRSRSALVLISWVSLMFSWMPSASHQGLSSCTSLSHPFALSHFLSLSHFIFTVTPDLNRNEKKRIVIKIWKKNCNQSMHTKTEAGFDHIAHLHSKK